MKAARAAAAKRVFKIASINLLNTHNQALEVMGKDPAPVLDCSQENEGANHASEEKIDYLKA